ncbi:helix-turn-helix domain protein [Burkholderia pseudomallei]|uniref:helix-turn-helix domain-containing protein n=1 Tax=Burkholderia pseudomallei TaxID=28450 RepID=UPI0005106B1E|nr:helix-turn-helix domain-containing protein [Burkholderia pseudomallei]KGC90929.1 helix-turn-helix domain protein [Burkholderia pseudomallei]
MNTRNNHTYPRGSSSAEQLCGAFSIARQITYVVQHANPNSCGVYRDFATHCIAGGKHLLPLGRGAGVPILYCHVESEGARIATRRELVSTRDPHDSSRKRAAENIRYYCLRRKDRADFSLLTRKGQHALWQESNLSAARVVLIDCLEGFTRKAGKEATSDSESAPLSELLARLTERGIAVVIFAKPQGRKKEPPEWLDGLTCNMVHIEEDTKNPMQGGARLMIYRDAVDELDRAPRLYNWWWKVDGEGKLDCSCREEHFVEPVLPMQKARDVRREEIKALIAEGITQQNEIATHLGVSPSTICRGVLREMIERGELLMDPKTKKLSLPAADAPLAEGTSDTGNDDDATDKEEDSSPVAPDKGTNHPMPVPKEESEKYSNEEPW